MIKRFSLAILLLLSLPLLAEENHYYSICIEKSKCGILDQNGKVIVPPKYWLASITEGKELIIVANWEGKKYKAGLYDISGKEIIPLENKRIKVLFSKGKSYVAVNDYKNWKLVDSKGNRLKTKNAKKIESLGANYFFEIKEKAFVFGIDKFFTSKKVGMYHPESDLFIEAKYNSIYAETENYLFTGFKDGDKADLINVRDKKIVDSDFGGFDFEKGLLIANSRDRNDVPYKKSLINLNGEVLLGPFDYFEPLNIKQAIIRDGSQFKVIDLPEHETLKDKPFYLPEGELEIPVAIVSEVGDKYGLLNLKGESVVEAKYDYVTPQYELFRVEFSKFNETTSGIIDSNGNYISELGEYDYCCLSVSEGLLDIHKNYKTGLMNRKGEVVFEPKYDSLSFFEKGIALVELDGKSGVINKEGKLLIPLNYKSITPVNKLFSINKDLKGYTYWYINDSQDTIFKAIKKCDQDLIIDGNNKVLWPVNDQIPTC